MDTARRAELVMNVLNRAIAGDADEGARLLVEVAANSTGQQMFNVCCGFANVAEQVLVQLFGQPTQEGLWALAAPDPAGGPTHPAHTFALRFVTAWLNGDLPTCQALYIAAIRASGKDYARSVCALVGLTAHLARAAAEDLAADREKPAPHPH
ncbi:hypothetical protein [Streptomyces kebangsaanensis]|uniref:hypothetical protein n=1 Tax=Streptomyces kebangsaanensis TaxID=864058 RepID=UPI000939A2DE|nr:hypothetical protein [Streptomyces kebangsaanensis]